jgi:hypothetical protein
MSRKHLTHREVYLESSSLGLLHAEHILQAHHWYYLGAEHLLKPLYLQQKMLQDAAAKRI